LRTVVTHEDFRKQGINGSLTHMVLDLIFAKWPDAVVVEVKNDASMGEALLKNAIGFTEISIGEIESLGVNVKELDQTWHFYKLTKAQYMAGPLNSSKRD
jgi:ribosomal protein S18 acetylase RimI-like enzyme